MKKIIIKGSIYILLGYILGYIFFSNKIELVQKLINKDTYYFIEQGIYYDKEILQNNISKISYKVIDKDKNKYTVYVGITKDREVAEKIKDVYEKNNIKTIIKEKYLSSEEFSNNVDQFDFLIKESKSEDELMTIEEVVLANYEEIIKNNATN